MTHYFHGVEVINSDKGGEVPTLVSSSIIGLIGTADTGGPLPDLTPTVVTNPKQWETLGDEGTLKKSLEAIFSQYEATCVVVKLPMPTPKKDKEPPGESVPFQKAVDALLQAESGTGYQPTLLVAPGLCNKESVTALEVAAQKLKAIAIVDGPNESVSGAIEFVKTFDSKRLYIIDPWVKQGETTLPPSGFAAGLIAKIDAEKGFWWSPSNQVISGITGITRAHQGLLSQASCDANRLNEVGVTTVVGGSGYRLWGNRTCSSNPRWRFLATVRIADVINATIEKSHRHKVDQPVTPAYLEHLTEGINRYLRQLESMGAILGGQCEVDGEKNTPETLSSGQVFLKFDFTAPVTAERITIESQLVNDYFNTVV